MFNQDYEKRLLRQHTVHMACNGSSEANQSPSGPSNVASPLMATPTIVSGMLF
jgi:hypothetical protein